MKLGHYNEMVAYRQTENGWYLMDETAEEVLLPNKFVPEGLAENTEISVFIYLDNEERPTATTQHPLIRMNRFAYLEVMDVNRIGAFVDWGLDKQLFVPYSEQMTDLKVGSFHLFYLKTDLATNRLLGSSKIYKYLDNGELSVNEGDEVELIIANTTELGRNVIINHRHKGLVFANQIFRDLRYGDSGKGYVKKIHPDNKIDIVLEKQGYLNMIDGNTQKVLDYLSRRNGFMTLTDKSSPDEIKLRLGMSKKNFKKALGNLYKDRKVRLERNGVYLMETPA